MTTSDDFFFSSLVVSFEGFCAIELPPMDAADGICGSICFC